MLAAGTTAAGVSLSAYRGQPSQIARRAHRAAAVRRRRASEPFGPLRPSPLCGDALRGTDFITSPGGVMLTISTTEVSYSHASAAVTRQYLHRDHLGSLTLVTDAAGAVLQRMSYDALRACAPTGRFAPRALTGGRRRNTNGTADGASLLEGGSLPDRGYTDHEHLEELLLIHMNGRLYDATIARFLSADPLVQDPFSGQAFNRYAYVDNNPLTYTDPTGYLKLGRIFNNKIVRIVAAVVAAVAIPAAVGSLMVSSATTAAMGAAAAGTGGIIGGTVFAAVAIEGTLLGASLTTFGAMTAAAIGGFASGLIMTGTLEGGFRGGAERGGGQPCRFRAQFMVNHHMVPREPGEDDAE